MFRIFSHFYRLFYIGICFLAGGSSEKSIAKILQRLGPSFIKLGQFLSVRPDIIGDDRAKALSTFRDRLSFFSFSIVKKIIEKELGGELNTIFAHFEETPVAAASIAQVHKAKLANGTFVAVKILRPGIEKAFKRDLCFFYFIAKFLSYFPSLKRLRLIDVVDTFAESISRELDLRIEAASGATLKENMKHDTFVYVPKIYWDLTSQRILVTEWIEGIAVHDIMALEEAGFNMEHVAKHITLSFFNQAFRDGFFHADTHHGNLFIDKEGRVVPIDFGIMGTLNEASKIYVAKIIYGFLTGNYKMVAQVHFEANYVPHDKSQEDFMLACRAIGEPIKGLPVDKISISRLLSLLFKVTRDFDMRTQPQLLLLQKTMVLIEGIGKSLYPKANMWLLVEPWIQEWAKHNLGPKKQLQQQTKELLVSFQQLPERIKQFDDFLEQFTADGLKLHPETLRHLNGNNNTASVSFYKWLFVVGCFVAVVILYLLKM